MHLIQLSKDSHRMMGKSSALMQDVSTVTLEEITVSADTANMVANYVPNDEVQLLKGD